MNPKPPARFHLTTCPIIGFSLCSPSPSAMGLIMGEGDREGLPPQECRREGEPPASGQDYAGELLSEPYTNALGLTVCSRPRSSARIATLFFTK